MATRCVFLLYLLLGLSGKYPNDGDLELIVAGKASAQQPGLILYRNDSPFCHWITFQLQGSQSTAQAVGAIVVLYAVGITLWKKASAGLRVRQIIHRRQQPGRYLLSMTCRKGGIRDLNCLAECRPLSGRAAGGSG